MRLSSLPCPATTGGLCVLPGTEPFKRAYSMAFMKRLRVVEKPKTESKPASRPGQIVPTSGIYRVEHRPHRLMHIATLLIGTRFPRCKRCGAAVRFALVRSLKDGRAVPFRSTAFLDAYPEDTSLPQAG